MTYAFGAANSPTHMLDIIEAFASSNGWSATAWVVSATMKRLNLSKATANNNGMPCYLSFEANNTTGTIVARGCSSLLANTTPASQPDAQSFASHTNLGAGPYIAYHAFADATGDYAHFVVEITAGTFRHLSFGELSKFGVYGGGHYISLSYADTSQNYIHLSDSGYHVYPFDGAGNTSATVGWAVSANVDTKAWRNVFTPNAAEASVFNATCCGQRHGMHDHLLRYSQPNTFNLTTPLLPIYVFAERQNPSTGDLAPIGFVKDVRSVWMQAYSDGQEITLGSDVWKIFPSIRRTGSASSTDGKQNSYLYGVAYKKIP